MLAELAFRGLETVEEPGRKIVQQELNGAGVALPSVSLEAFARRAIDTATGDRDPLGSSQSWVFFDRGLLDVAVALAHATGLATSVTMWAATPSAAARCSICWVLAD